MKPILYDPIVPRWSGPVIIAAPGPSLTSELAEQCRGLPCVVVNDAYRLLPWADILYAADYKWWRVHHGCPNFLGEKYIPSARVNSVGECRLVVKDYHLRVIEGKSANTFSLEPERIHYGVLGTGANGGFQALNLTILFGGNPIILVGFDMRPIDGRAHFFGDHPRPLMRKQNFSGWIKNITAAAKALPPHIRIINATPGSALRCFPIMTLADALKEINNGAGSRYAA